jgi:hypothetical protein
VSAPNIKGLSTVRAWASAGEPGALPNVPSRNSTWAAWRHSHRRQQKRAGHGQSTQHAQRVRPAPHPSSEQACDQCPHVPALQTATSRRGGRGAGARGRSLGRLCCLPLARPGWPTPPVSAAALRVLARPPGGQTACVQEGGRQTERGNHPVSCVKCLTQLVSTPPTRTFSSAARRVRPSRSGTRLPVAASRCARRAGPPRLWLCVVCALSWCPNALPGTQ